MPIPTFEEVKNYISSSKTDKFELSKPEFGISYITNTLVKKNTFIIENLR